MTPEKGSPRLLLITQYYPPDITAAAFRMGGMAGSLAAEGYDVTVLTTAPHKSVVSIDPPQPVPGIEVIRVPMKARSHLIQYFSFFILAMRRFREISRRGKPGVVLASSPPLSVFLVGMILSSRLRASLILDVRDLWPDTPAALNRLPRSGPVYRLFKKLELRGYRKADEVTCVAGPMADRIREQGANTVTVVYNGVSRDDLENAKRWSTASPPRRGEPWQVFYFGNLGLAQGLDVLLEAGEKMDRNRFNIHLIGAGAGREKILGFIQSRKLNHFHLHAALPRETLLPTVAGKAHVLFFNLDSDPVFFRTIPSKLFDFLLLRRPIVAGIQGEGAGILSRTGSVELFDGQSPEELLKALNRAVMNWDVLTKKALECNLKEARGFLREDQYARMGRVVRRARLKRLTEMNSGRSN